MNIPKIEELQTDKIKNFLALDLLAVGTRWFWETAPVVTQAAYVAQPRSILLLALAFETSPELFHQVE